MESLSFSAPDGSQVSYAQQAPSRRLDYKLAATTAKLLTNRRTVYFNSDRPTYNQGDIITITINSSDLMDAKNSFLMFKMKLTVSSNILNGSVHRIFQRVRLSTNSGVILNEIDDAGLLARVIYDFCALEDYKHSTGQLHGFGSYKLQITGGANLAAQISNLVTGVYVDGTAANSIRTQLSGDGLDRMASDKTYIVSLGDVVPLLQVDQLLPMKQIGPLKLEIFLTSSGKYSFTSRGYDFPDKAKCAAVADLKDPNKRYSLGTAATGTAAGSEFPSMPYYAGGNAVADIDKYTVTAVNYVADVVSYSTEIDRLLTEMANSGRLIISYNNYTSTTTVVTSQEMTIKLTKAAFDIKSLFAVIRPVALENVLIDSFESLFNMPTELKQWQIKSNTLMFPTRPVQSVEESFVHCLKSWGRFFKTQSSNISLSDFDRTRFVIGYDLETSPESSYTGLSTVNGSSIDLEISLASLGLNPLTSVAATSARVTTFLLNTRILIVMANNNIVIKE